MNIEDVKSLISLIDDSTLTELHYQTGDFQLLLSKNKLVQTNQQSSDNIQAEVPSPAVIAPVQNLKEAVSEAATAKEGKIITSPIVGVVYWHRPLKQNLTPLKARASQKATLSVWWKR